MNRLSSNDTIIPSVKVIPSTRDQRFLFHLYVCKLLFDIYSINVITLALKYKTLVNFALRGYVLHSCYSAGDTKKAIHLLNRVSDNSDNSAIYSIYSIYALR